jgi:transposase
MSRSQSTGVYSLFVGVDIAATTATVSWMRPGEKASRPLTIEQTPEGYASLERKLRATGKVPAEVLVVMEATGGLLDYIGHPTSPCGVWRECD